MKKKQVLLIIAVSLFLVMPIAAAVQAAQPIVGSKPLATEIKINKNIIAQPISPTVSNEDFKATLDGVKKALVEWDYIDGSADWQQKKCAEKSYSVADQKAAGCLGTDTVDACAQKLYHHCMQTGAYYNSYMSKLKVMKDAVDNLINKSTLYKNGLNEAEKKYQ